MKTETAWNELRRSFKDRGLGNVVKDMDDLLAQPEPDYVYRMTVEHPWGRKYTVAGSRHKIVCNLNANRGYWRHGERPKVIVSRSSTWNDVTEDFAKWLS